MLAWVLEKAGGKRFPDLVAEELCQHMGAEHDADTTIDAHGNALADGGISVTLRDAGRIGLLALRRGRAEAGAAGGAGTAARQVLPPEWLGDTVAGVPDGPWAFRAGDGAKGYPPGAHYRTCWWVTNPSLPTFNAVGIHGQHIFVHGPGQTVVVELSS